MCVCIHCPGRKEPETLDIALPVRPPAVGTSVGMW